MKFIPLYERVLVQVLGGVKEVGGFVLPDNVKDDYLVGSVISTGFGYRKENGDLVPLLVKPGMVAMFGPHAGTPIQVDKKPYLTMRELELVGILCAEQSPCGICPDCLNKVNEVFEPVKIANNAVMVEPGIVEIG